MMPNLGDASIFLISGRVLAGIENGAKRSAYGAVGVNPKCSILLHNVAHS